MKTATATKINQTNINTDLFCMEWSPDCLQHFEALTRSIFLPLLYDDDSFGITGDRLMELLHRIMASSQMVSGKCKVFYILRNCFTFNPIHTIFLKINFTVEWITPTSRSQKM